MPKDFVVSELTDDAKSRLLFEQILSALPDWFGPYENYRVYLDDISDHPTFAVMRGEQPMGIMALTKTSDAAVDIHVIAVAPHAHGQGVGHALISHAVAFAKDCAATFLTVKTLGPGRENDAYAQTRQFYEKEGFAPLEEFVDFWGEGYPMLLLCRIVN